MHYRIQSIVRPRAVLAVLVRLRYVSRRLISWGLNKKKLKYKHILKFTAENVRYTCRYLAFIDTIVDLTRVHFIDEATYRSSELLVKEGRSFPSQDAVEVAPQNGECLELVHSLT